jgi:hypothetical protein
MLDGRWIIAILQVACAMVHSFQPHKVKIQYTLNTTFLHVWKGNIFALGLSYLCLKHNFYQRRQGILF